MQARNGLNCGMRICTLFLLLAAALALGSMHCEGTQVWENGHSLLEVIGYDMKAHDTRSQLSEYETGAVCLLLGYFRGFAEGAAIACHYNAAALPFYLPDNITDDEMERVVYKFLSANPDKLDLKGDALVAAALAKAFPNIAFTPADTSKK